MFRMLVSVTTCGPARQAGRRMSRAGAGTWRTPLRPCPPPPPCKQGHACGGGPHLPCPPLPTHLVGPPDQVQHQQARRNLDQVLRAAAKALAASGLALRLGPAQHLRQAAHACTAARGKQAGAAAHSRQPRLWSRTGAAGTVGAAGAAPCGALPNLAAAAHSVQQGKQAHRPGGCPRHPWCSGRPAAPCQSRR